MDGDALLPHQVHPAKVATDICAEVVSDVLLRRRQLAWGLVTHVLAHMPPVAQGVRLAGDAMMAYGAWRRRPAVMAAGPAVVGLGWSHGLLPAADR